ncbi:response regulator [candidate division KSB1 bacterium]|nr:response regulator [candidate division KSB1 bacterium]
MAEKKILIIDDDEDIVLAMRIVLEKNHYKVSWAKNGEEGLETLKKEKPDLIILDVMMDSQTEGFHTAYKIRGGGPDSEYADFKDIPIVMITAIHQSTPIRFDDAVESEWLPVDEFIEKPIRPEQLLSVVKRLVK